LLVVMMLWKPAGLFPSARRKLDIGEAGVTETPKEGREP